MTGHQTDRALLEASWRLYDEEFTDHVGDVVTPYDHVDTEADVEWGAQVFMFGYALGSIAGARTTAPERRDRDLDGDRVAALVDTVTDIAGGDEVPVSSASIKQDFLGDEP